MPESGLRTANNSSEEFKNTAVGLCNPAIVAIHNVAESF